MPWRGRKRNVHFGLFGQTRYLVKYNCAGGLREVSGVQRFSPCSWSGLFPLEIKLMESQMRELFACPLHGIGPVSIVAVEYDGLENTVRRVQT